MEAVIALPGVERVRLMRQMAITIQDNEAEVDQRYVGAHLAGTILLNGFWRRHSTNPFTADPAARSQRASCPTNGRAPAVAGTHVRYETSSSAVSRTLHGTATQLDNLLKREREQEPVGVLQARDQSRPDGRADRGR